MKTIPLVVIGLHFFAMLILFYFKPYETKNCIGKQVAVNVLTIADPMTPHLPEKGRMEEQKAAAEKTIRPPQEQKKDAGSRNPSSENQNWEKSQETAKPNATQENQKFHHVPNKKPRHHKQLPTPLPPNTGRANPTPTVTPHPKVQTPSAKKTLRPLSMQKESQNQLIANLEQSLKALNHSLSPEKKSPTSPLLTLASEQLLFGTNYEEDLIAYLQQLLCLPEKGEVKIKLELQKKGSVKQVEILHSTSERNERYIKTALEDTLLLPLSKEFKDRESHTFTITLTST